MLGSAVHRWRPCGDNHPQVSPARLPSRPRMPRNRPIWLLVPCDSSNSLDQNWRIPYILHCPLHCPFADEWKHRQSELAPLDAEAGAPIRSPVPQDTVLWPTLANNGPKWSAVGRSWQPAHENHSTHAPGSCSPAIVEYVRGVGPGTGAAESLFFLSSRSRASPIATCQNIARSCAGVNPQSGAAQTALRWGVFFRQGPMAVATDRGPARPP